VVPWVVVILLHDVSCSQTEDAVVEQHLAHFGEDLKAAKAIGAAMVISQVGHNWWSDSSAIKFIVGADKLAVGSIQQLVPLADHILFHSWLAIVRRFKCV
jgi:hypothetical protein